MEQIIQSLEKQLDHRLDKLWKIFSFANSILVAVSAGLIILPRTEKVIFDIIDRVLISVVILIITSYAILWIRENLIIEGKIRSELDKIFSQKFNYPEYSSIRPDKAKFGYRRVIGLLGLTALIAAWIDCFKII